MVVLPYKAFDSLAAGFLKVALHEFVDGNVKAGAESPGYTDH